MKPTRLLPALLATAMLSLALGASTASAKEFLLDFGSTGTLGGQFSDPRGIAVNETGNGAPAGTVYVNDFGNRRIQQLDADGNFIRTWGWDVVQEGRPDDTASDEFEVCTIAADCKAGASGGGAGQFVAGGIAGGIAVHQASGNVYVIDRNNFRVQQFDPVGNFIRTWGRDVIQSGRPGDISATAFEICTVPADCKAGVSGTGAGMFGTPAGALSGIGVDAAGNVYVADSANSRIQKFNSAGGFLRLAGWDVVDTGPGDDVVAPEDEFEICVPANGDVCKAGIAGSGAGQFVDNRPAQLAASPAGDVYAVENTRIQRFDPDLVVDPGFAPAIVLSGGNKNGVAVDSATGNLFFSKAGDENIYEVDPATQLVVDSTPSGAAGWFHLAVNGASGRLYASGAAGNSIRVFQDAAAAPIPTTLPATEVAGTTATLNGTVNPHDFALTDCRFEYVTEADFQATGFIDLSSGGTELCDPPAASIPADSSSHDVEANVTGLLPNGAEYRFRLLVEFAGGTVAANDVRLRTGGPIVKATFPQRVGYTAATLGAVVNPNNAATTYRFEYLTEAEFAANGDSFAGPNVPLRSPDPDGAVGSDSADHEVSAEVEGLQQGTTYRFRVVATNVDAVNEGPDSSFPTFVPVPEDRSCPNDEIRAQQGITHLPDCLAYEMVSPPDKNQGSVNQGGVATEGMPSRDGNAAAFCTTALFGEPTGQQSGNHCAPYLSRRTPSGWQTGNPFPPICVSDRAGQNKTPSSAFSLDVELSPNFDRAVVTKPESAACPIPPLDPAAPLPAWNLYRQDLSTDPFEFGLLATEPSLNGSGGNANFPYGGSDDYSHILYQSLSNQTPDSPPAGSFSKLYEWVEQGPDCGLADPSLDPVLGSCLRLVSVKPDGSPFTTASKPPGLWEVGSWLQMPDAVSAGGSRIFFQNEVSLSVGANPGFCSTPACDLYVREDGSETIQVSRSECTVDCGADSSFDRFLAANPAGDIAYFLSCAKLTDSSNPSTACPSGGGGGLSTSAGAKIYRWAGEGHGGCAEADGCLIDIAVDRKPADGVQANALDIVGGAIADGGDTAFFLAGGQIVSGEPTGSFLKLYRWRWNGGSPLVDYLGPYLVTDGSTTVPGGGDSTTDAFNDRNVVRHSVRVTPDGRYLLLRTRLAYDPAADRDDDLDLYRWGEAEGWQCISCQLPGAPSAGDADSILTYLIGGSGLSSVEPAHALSDDGRRVYFSTPDALVPEDTNGEAGCPIVFAVYGYAYSCQDVYLWEDGRLSLITSGTGTEPFVLMGATASGERVFFETKQRLVGWDVDLGTDIYTARVNGGFPEPPPAPVPCDLNSGACEGPGSAAANVPGAGSAAFQGPGNPRPQTRTRCPRGKRKVTRNGRTRCVPKKRKRGNRAAKHNRGVAR